MHNKQGELWNKTPVFLFSSLFSKFAEMAMFRRLLILIMLGFAAVLPAYAALETPDGYMPEMVATQQESTSAICVPPGSTVYSCLYS
ncbi:hypothetical protein LP421_07780 [Rhizobium sp. RCAM05350]|nr:hypothetical protein LP421_07780 [Rhizobium sp. RCAM05350]